MGWQKDVRYGQTLCFDVSIGGDRAPVNFYSCHGGGGNQLWRYDQESRQIIHVNTKRCLTLDQDQIVVSSCSKSDQLQKWTWEKVNLPALAQWDNNL